METSFGKYFDDQRDRMRKAMQNKNAQQNIEWMERYEKRKEKNDLAILSRQDKGREKTKEKGSLKTSIFF